MLNDAKSQSCSASAPGTRLIDPIEPFETSRQLFLRDANSGVTDVDSHTIFDSVNINVDFPARLVVFNGVLKQVQQRVLQSKTLTGNESIISRTEKCSHAARVCLRFDDSKSISSN